MKKKTTQRNVRFIFLCDTCISLISIFEYTQVFKCVCVQTKNHEYGNFRRLFFIQDDRSMDQIQFRFFIEMADEC